MGLLARNLIAYFVGEETESSEAVTPAEPAQLTEPVLDSVAEEATEPAVARESTATGNDEIEILRHELYCAHEDNLEPSPAGVVLAIQNLADSTIATVVVEVAFYDIEGRVLGIVRHKAIELRPDTSRSIRINAPVKDAGQVTSYAVRIAKTRTADVEKVQIRSHGMNRNAAGEQVVEGIVKNVSKVKADAAVVISFFDADKEEIGRKILVLRDIEPESIRRYDLAFRPPEGEVVGTYSIVLAEMAG